MRRYIHGPGIDEPVAMTTGTGFTTISYYHADYLGSIVAMSDNTGALSEQYRYSPYGEVDDTSGNPFRYTGRRLDAETGLYYYRARYYSATLGRFLQVDPIGYGDGLNTQAYVGNDPINATDPSGTTGFTEDEWKLLLKTDGGSCDDCEHVTVTGSPLPKPEPPEPAYTPFVNAALVYGWAVANSNAVARSEKRKIVEKFTGQDVCEGADPSASLDLAKDLFELGVNSKFGKGTSARTPGLGNAIGIARNRAELFLENGGGVNPQVFVPIDKTSFFGFFAKFVPQDAGAALAATTGADRLVGNHPRAVVVSHLPTRTQGNLIEFTFSQSKTNFVVLLNPTTGEKTITGKNGGCFVFPN